MSHDLSDENYYVALEGRFLSSYDELIILKLKKQQLNS